MSFRWPVRIYWEDTDAGGVVYYANYLRFMERARTEYLRERGIDQSRLQEAQGIVMVIRRVAVDYRLPARLDDELEVSVVVDEVRAASFAMSQEVVRRSDEAVLVTGRVEAACLDAERWKPCRLPRALRAAVAAD